MNPLDAYPALRKVLFLLQWLTTGATGVLGIVFTAQGNVPTWYTVTVACLAFVWTYTGITAQGNVPDEPQVNESEVVAQIAPSGAVVAGPASAELNGTPVNVAPKLL